jgi:hypothetical protein
MDYLSKKYDVVVAGGGPAGIGAALGAAKAGAKALLIEKCGFLGGVAIASLLCTFMPGYTDYKRNIIEGVYSELVDRLIQKDAIFISPTTGDPFDPEICKLILDDMMEENGVEVLFHSFVSGVECNDGTVEGIYIENKSGRSLVKANMFIDATGDGDLAVKAGATYDKDVKRGLMPQSMIYSVQGVDFEGFIEEYSEKFDDYNIKYHSDGKKVKSALVYFKAKEEIREAKQKGEYNIPRDEICAIWVLPNHPGEVYIHASRIIGCDATDAFMLSKAETLGRKQVIESLKFMKKYIKGFENCFLSKIATQIGVRQTRQIIGEYIITGDDLTKCTQFDDVIAQGTYGIDFHSTSGVGTRLEKLEHGTHYDIPFRALIPKDLNNLLIAGRCISADVEAMSGFRVIPIVMAIGQAAGAAAALCSLKGFSCRNLSYTVLHDELIKQNACLS